MKKLLPLFLAFFSLAFLFHTPTINAEEESDFALPIEDWVVLQDGQEFGAYRGPDRYHLGDDVMAPVGTEIYAIADGEVKHIGIHTRYGTVILIEHTLNNPSKEKIVSVYGHLRRNDVRVEKGDIVEKGQLIGYLGEKGEENGYWEEHLHFGIKKGAYTTKWVYWGMGKQSLLDGWYNPSEFFEYEIGIITPEVDITKDYSNGKIITGPGKGGSSHIRVIKPSGSPYTELGFLAKPKVKSGADIAITDFEKDGNHEIVVGYGPGEEPRVAIFDKLTQKEESSFLAYNESFKGGIRVATGDINGDGKIEIITAAGPGGGAHLRIFNRQGKVLHGKIFPFGKDVRTGADITTGDLNNDGIDEIIVAMGPSKNGEETKVTYLNNKLKPSTIITPYPNFKGGAHVGAGDIDADGKDEIIVGAGPGGGPQVRVFEANGTPRGIQFFPFHPDFRGGIDVAAIDFDEDGKDEIIASQFSNGQAWVKIYRYNKHQTILSEFIAYRKTFEGGTNIDGKR